MGRGMARRSLAADPAHSLIIPMYDTKLREEELKNRVAADVFGAFDCACTWTGDIEFHLDCLAFTLFHGQNRISCGTTCRPDDLSLRRVGAEYDGLLPDGSNTETQSHGDTEQSRASVPLGLCASVLKSTRPEGLTPAFAPAAQAVFDAGRALYRHYHAQPGAVPDASFYDNP